MTDPTTPAERERRRALAGKATQGPWRATKFGVLAGPGPRGPLILSWDHAWWTGANEAGDKPHIAAWDPDTCRAYIEAAAERDALREQVAELKAQCRVYRSALRPRPHSPLTTCDDPTCGMCGRGSGR